MGKRSSQKKAAVLLDKDVRDSKKSSSTIRSNHLVEADPEDVEFSKDYSLDACVDALYEKRGTTREKALALIIKPFSNKVQYAYVQKKFATILHLCLNSIKRGSAKEIALAAQLIGLMALTTGPGDKAREILVESVGPISEALKSQTAMSKACSLLECLAVITFVGGEDMEQIENSLQLMWQVANPKQRTNVIAVKSDPTIIETVVSAWAFLFTAINASTLNPESWQESISFLSSLLEKDDRSVRIAAGESLALVFETGNLKNLGDELRASSDTLSERSNDLVHKHDGLLSKVVEQVGNLSAESGGKGTAKKDLNSQRNTFKDIQDFLKGGCCPATSMKIGGKSVSTETWAQLIQLNFIKRFLGGGFANHMQKNEFLQDLFGFTRQRSLSGIQRTMLNRNKEIIVGHIRSQTSEKRLFKSPNSYLNKARTQIRNKDRTLSQNINSGPYGVEVDNT